MDFFSNVSQKSVFSQKGTRGINSSKIRASEINAVIGDMLISTKELRLNEFISVFSPSEGRV